MTPGPGFASQVAPLHMSRVMAYFCLCKNKGADQLSKNCKADQHPCFRYTDNTIFILLISKILACFCDCTGWFVSDLAGNPTDHVSGVMAHMEKRLLKNLLFYLWMVRYNLMSSVNSGFS